jgi:hypothetical protein
MNGLTETEQGTARRLFVTRLISPAGADTRQVLRRSDCTADDWQIIIRMANERLLTIGRSDDGCESAEVVHEALLRAWGHLHSWLAAEQPFRSWRQLLRYSLTQWRDTTDSRALLAGTLLATSVRWLDERTADLDHDERRFIEMSLARAALDDSFTHVSETLDFDQLGQHLVNGLTRHFCTSGELLMLEDLVSGDAYTIHSHGDHDGSQHVFRRVAAAHKGVNPAWDAAFPAGEVLRYPSGSMYVQCLDSGEPVLEVRVSEGQARQVARTWRRQSVAKLLAGTSMLLLPLSAANMTLGFLVCSREPGQRPFDSSDVELGIGMASRAAVFLTNARRFNMEHATALTLQRSMLPTGLSAPSSVEVRHRYLPGSKLLDVGGDWCESITLPGARVALVVGDVAGHGVRAAVTMGRIRAAIHTLAMQELPPVESLLQLDELMHTLGEREPHFATCAYVVYDAVSGECEVAVAGHLPPLLVHPDGSNELVDVPPSPPLGIGGGDTESRLFNVEDGSLFLLYTDGLVEDKARDISDGLARLQAIFGPDSVEMPLDDLCRATLQGLHSDDQLDDIAVLIARLHRLPEDSYATWKLSPKLTSVHDARSLIVEPMKRWGLTDLQHTTQLLVSELVTNAMRYSRGEVTLRLINERALICEVHDNNRMLPRPRPFKASDNNELGRGLEVVRQLTRRWGARPTATGKVVWCEQALPVNPS